MRHRFNQILAYIFIIVVISGCSAKEITLSINHIQPSLENTETSLVAGSASMGITPPPGMPMAGYSKISTDAIGVRSKLMARAIYINSGKCAPVALVQCDLLSGSLALHHKVAELIAKQTDVDAGGLMIACSHSHSGPGNYFANMFYNKAASNGSGFDDKCFEFLSNQIAKAVIKAYTNRRPAKIATGTTIVTGVSINRSLSAYIKNKNIETLEKKPSKKEAVNPYLHMIRIDCLHDDNEYKPIGAFTNFSMHNNTNPKELGSVYNGDVFAYFERGLEWKIQLHYNTPWKPVNAAANYTHGDCNPAHCQDRVENFRDFEKLGNAITASAFKLFQSLDDKLTDNVQLSYRVNEIDVLKENEINGVKIADRPFVGMSALGGAQGRGRQPIFGKLPYFFAPGHPRWLFNKGAQGHKRRAGSIFQPLILPKKTFPYRLFVQVIRIDDTVLLPLPFEVTYEMGMRIAENCRQKGADAGLENINRYVVTGVSNGYWGYVTTKEEYAIQYYEGGSTLYGPNTGPFLSAHLSNLVKEMSIKGTGGMLPKKWEIPLTVKNFYKENELPDGKRKSNQDPIFHEARKRDEAFWSFKWFDVPESYINLHEDLISIESSMDGKEWRPCVQSGIKVDDTGCDMSIILVGNKTKDGMTLYETRWHSPATTKDQFYRFAVHPRKGQAVLYSKAFRSQ